MLSLVDLTDRQREILKTVIHCFIESAVPVASQRLARYYFVDLSPATIRNVLAELEERGYIDHPHTSAGRVPTDLGYRVYVDSLMKMNEPSVPNRRAIQQKVDAAADTEEILRETAKILAKISQQLVVISSPHLSSGVLEKIELVSISSIRMLVILTMKSRLVKTMTMEVFSEVPREKLENIGRLLNERLSGLTLKKIRDTFASRVQDMKDEETGLIRLFLHSRSRLFDDSRERERLYISGAQNMVDQPEFDGPEQFKNIMEFIDDEDVIVHVLEEYEEKNNSEEVAITIGSENKNEKLRNYSFLVSAYHVGDVSGSIALLGPKRMNYAKTVPLVNYSARTISSALSQG